MKQLAVKSAEGPKEKNVSLANSLAHVPSSSTTTETRTLRQSLVPLAHALETIFQWLLVNLEPDEFSRETFSVYDWPGEATVDETERRLIRLSTTLVESRTTAQVPSYDSD